MVLQLLILVSRHGERERLSKHHTSLAEASDPALTQTGLTTIKSVGNLLRARYLDPNTCGSNCLNGTLGNGGFAAHEVRAESSGFARTLGTAEVLLSSLFPVDRRGSLSLPLPIFSHTPEADARLRGYYRCPVLGAALEAWRVTPAYLEKVTETAALRKALAKALPLHEDVKLDADGAVPLHQVWNAFDAITTSASASELEPELLANVAALAAWLEAHKFGRAGGGAHACGGALLGEIVRRISAVSEAQEAGQERLVYYSAHYPTMLCLLSALGVSADAQDVDDASRVWLSSTLLALSSVIALEVHATSSGSAPSVLKLKYLDPKLAATEPLDTAALRPLPLPRCSSSLWECAIPEDLQRLTDGGKATLPASLDDWHAACGRNVSTLDATPIAPVGVAQDACSMIPTPIEWTTLSLLVALWLAIIAWCAKRSLGSSPGHPQARVTRVPFSTASSTSSTPAVTKAPEFSSSVVVMD